ncbi:TPA: hypothetical protein ACX6Q6_002744 [Photobacterium damselae]
MIEWGISSFPYNIPSNIYIPYLDNKAGFVIEGGNGLTYHLDCKEPILHWDGMSRCGVIEHNPLDKIFIPVLLRKTQSMCNVCSHSEDVTPYACIYIHGYTDFDEQREQLKQSNSKGLLGTVFGKDKKQIKSNDYVKVFCHLRFNISPSIFQLKPHDIHNSEFNYHPVPDGYSISDDDSIIFESPYIPVNESVSDMLDASILNALSELVSITKERYIYR